MSFTAVFKGDTSRATSARMSRVLRRDTGPELRLRHELYRRGLRYRIDAGVSDLPRHRVDVLFKPVRVAVFVDGCFWHSCPIHGSRPKANRDWWDAKFERIRERDALAEAKLTAAGWLVLRVWEHEPAILAADRVENAVRQRKML
jgi:DNA mismatch endonuclease, patch repair protein